MAAIIFVRFDARRYDAIGIVEMSSAKGTRIRHPLQNLTSSLAREGLAAALSRMQRNDNNMPCTKCAIERVVQVFSSSNFHTRGGKVLILSENMESGLAPALEERLKSQRLVVHATSFGGGASSAFEHLSKVTGGGMLRTNDVMDAFRLVLTFPGYSDGDTLHKSVEIYRKRFRSDGHIEDEMFFDSAIGGNTLFIFTASGGDEHLQVSVHDPDGAEHQPLTTVGLSTIFRIPGIAKAGRWQYEAMIPENQTVDVTVTSMPVNDSKHQILVDAGFTISEIAGKTLLMIYAQVTKLDLPLLNATVNAFVRSPDGDVESLELFDKGADPDINANDGVYSRYFFKFKAAGLYYITVKVTGEQDIAVVAEEWTLSTAAINYAHASHHEKSANTRHELTERESISKLETFQRFSDIGSFKPRGKLWLANEDLLPPSGVMDLRIEPVNFSQPIFGLNVHFTAPGDDMDSGKAFRYEIRYSATGSHQLLHDFENAARIPTNSIQLGDINDPKRDGNQEKFKINISNVPFDNTVSKISFAVRAIDESKNIGKVSNIVTLDITLIVPSEHAQASAQGGKMKEKGLKATTPWIIAVVCGVAVILAALLTAWLCSCYRRKRKSEKYDVERNTNRHRRDLPSTHHHT